MKISAISAEKTWPLRHLVMWPDHPAEFVRLPDDHSGLHYGLYTSLGLVSVVSVFRGDGHARFRKFATLQSCQGKGYGSALLWHIIEKERQYGTQTLWCSARTEKTDFYTRFGFRASGEVFLREDQPYRKMTLQL